MATLISGATGNFTAAGTWKLADATAELDSEAGSSVTTATFVASANFAPGAITVDAICCKILSRIASPVGTFTIDLYNSTAAASVASVVVNVTDIATTGGWYAFPITPTLLLVANNYQIRVRSSTASEVTVYRNATAGNWSRQLRTTTNQAPAAGDKLLVLGEHTGAGTGNNFSVTMDETAATIYGDVSFLQSIFVGKRATLSYGTAATTNYLLKLAGLLRVHNGGTFNIGTAGTPIPSTSTAKLEFSVATNVDSGLQLYSGSVFSAQGNALGVHRALLNADIAAAGTVLTTDVATGWLTGDEIAISSTSRILTEGEKRTLSINAAGTAVTVSSGLTYAHTGTAAETKAEIINLTRNVKINGTSATLCGFVFAQDSAMLDVDFAEFYFLGSATALKHGVEIQTSTGNTSFNACSFHDYFTTASTAVGVYSSVTNLNNVAVTDCNFWDTNYISLYFTAANPALTATVAISGNWMMRGVTTSSYGILCAVAEATISNNRISGSGIGIQLSNTAGGKLGTHSGNVIHSCTNGYVVQHVFAGTISSSTVWKTAGQALNLNNCTRVVIDGFTSFGNTTSALTLTDNKDCLLKNIVSNSYAGSTQPYGIYLTGPNPGTVISGSSFGATTGHTTADIVTTAIVNDIIFENTIFASATEFSVSTWKLGGEYMSHGHQGVAGNIKRVAWEGTSTRDTVIFNTASPSLRLAPATTVVKLQSPYFKVPVNSGSTMTASVYVRKSVVGDGTAYNGSQPRLMAKFNPVGGISTTSVIATAVGAAGSWELISGTTVAVSENTVVEFFVECDGTTGWVNVDDFSALGDDTSGFAVWDRGLVYAVSSGPSGKFTDVAQSDVRLGVAYKYNSLTNNRTGTLDIPAPSDVKLGVIYDNTTKTGTYTGAGSDQSSNMGFGTFGLND